MDNLVCGMREVGHERGGGKDGSCGMREVGHRRREGGGGKDCAGGAEPQMHEILI